LKGNRPQTTDNRQQSVKRSRAAPVTMVTPPLGRLSQTEG